MADTRRARTWPLDSPPLIRVGLPEYVKGAQPAAGASFTDRIPGQHAARLVTLFVRLVTDANVADRTVIVQYLDPEGNPVLVVGAPVTQSASATNDYAFQAFLGRSDWPVGDTILVTLPPLLLIPTFSWTITIDNVQVGDQLSRIRFIRETFYMGDPVAFREPA